jgi:chromosome segregation protein
MTLKKLSIFGFKSFADKTELDFGEGMTAVIGPNGCGKSNVVDAIRWVFGEQKASILRSANMQDVIFSGTQKRAPLNMAEVTLVIENSRGILPVEYSEVAITRRIYRSGESEYRLNKVPCRLRDIQNIFLDTGVGSSAYTTIENKMIEKILSDKAEERRLLFEEAAGIGKYKHARRESRAKLDKTRQDLLRINDRVEEADRQVRTLARHVDRAKRYKGYYDALKAIETAFECRRYDALTKVILERGSLIAEAQSRREALKASVASAELRVEKMQFDALEKENELGTASRGVLEAGEGIAAIDRDLSVAAERTGNLKAAVTRLDGEAAQLDRESEEASQLKVQIEKSVVEREALLRESSERAAGAGAELAAFDARLSDKRREADDIGRNQIELINNLSEARNRQSVANGALSAAIDGKSRNEREIATLEARHAEYEDAAEACRRQLDEVNSANSGLMDARAVLLERIETEEERYGGLVEKEKGLEARISSNKSQLKFLEGLDATFQGYEDGVRALLTARLPGLRGIVADLVSVSDDRLLPLVEKLAGNVVQTVVFDDDARMEAAVDFLRRERAGAARVVSLERLRRQAANHPSGRAFPAGLIDVRSLIKVDADCTALADSFFDRFAIAPDYASAAGAALEMGAYGTAAIVSVADGAVCYGDGSVAAGESKKESAGILQRKQQMEKLSAEIGVAETELTAILTEKDICVIARDGAKAELIDVNEKINGGQRLQQEQQTTIKHYENEMQGIAVRVQAVAPEIEALAVKITELTGSIAEIEAEVSVMETRRGELAAQSETAREGVRAMEEERAALADHLKNVELEVHGLTNRIGNDKRDIERLADNIQQFGQRKLSKIEERAKCLSEISGLEESAARMTAELEAARERRTGLEAARDVIREDYNGRLAEINDLRNEIKAVNGDLAAVGDSIHDGELKQANDEQERRRIRERMWESYELDIEGLDREGLAAVDEDGEAVTRDIAMYKERIKQVGQVNMAALDDFNTESERLRTLTVQRDDLQGAVDELERAISKLDKEARAQFIATFGQVQKNFTDMFTTLFEGGEANISLDEGVDPLEADIHINARPAGKKMRGVQLLSGGERALTAISLLFALYLVKPSAYCILDELDAPLDESNVGRFVKVLGKFAERTQFIVITHNKKTMEAADLLYGVTQQESGVSTIVSVKFEEAGGALRAA